MLWLPWTLGAGLAITLGIALWAWRGKKVDNHPLCRKCGFDLTGKPVASTRCPECGTDVTRPKAIRIGHRQSRRRLLLTATTLVGLLLAGSIGGGAWWLKGRDLNPYKPVWLLGRELSSPDALKRVNALRELQLRIRQHSAADSSLAALAHRLLDEQQKLLTNPSAFWTREQAQAVNVLRSAGQFDDHLFRRYLRQGLLIDITPASSVTRDSHLRLFMTARMRGGTPLPDGLLADLRADLRINQTWQPLSYGGLAFNSPIATSALYPFEDPSVEDGPVTYAARMSVDARSSTSVDNTQSTILFTMKWEGPIEIEVLPKEAPATWVRPGDEDLQAAIHLSLNAPIATGLPGISSQPGGTLAFKDVPRDMRLRLTLIDHDKEWFAGWFQVQRGKSAKWGWMVPRKSALSERVTIELREDPGADPPAPAGSVDPAAPPATQTAATVIRYENVSTGNRPAKVITLTPTIENP